MHAIADPCLSISGRNYPQSPPIISENKYSYGPETPLTSPPIQPQSTMAPVKQEYYAPEQQQQQPQMQQQMYPQQQQQTYQTAVNLANLSEAPAPVDCPVCRHRALTVVEKHSGNTVQYVFPFSSPFLSLPSYYLTHLSPQYVYTPPENHHQQSKTIKEKRARNR